MSIHNPRTKNNALELVSKIGRFGDEFYASTFSKYDDNTFMNTLNVAINNKDYASITRLFKKELSCMNFKRQDPITLSKDEKLLQKELTAFGFTDYEFYNPLFDFENLPESIVQSNYEESDYGQRYDHENNIQWDFEGPLYVYRNGREKTMSYDFEPHIFWNDVNQDIIDGVFDENKLKFLITAKCEYDHWDTQKPDYSKSINLLDSSDNSFEDLKKLLVPAWIKESYINSKNDLIRNKDDNFDIDECLAKVEKQEAHEKAKASSACGLSSF